MKCEFTLSRRPAAAFCALSVVLIALAGCEQSSPAYFTATSYPSADIQRRITRAENEIGKLAKDKAGAPDDDARKTIEDQQASLEESIKRSKEELAALPEKQRLVTTIVTAMFGTPDQPVVLSATGLDANKVRLAAGPATANQQGRTAGLYRIHCVHCHGVSGNGAGPTGEFLNPYPRDFRHGWFKFKSTGINEKPTDDDLRRVLREGINGTAMPSFKLLPAAEIDALIEYVKYLSIRGEVENELLSDKNDRFQTCKELFEAAKQDPAKAEEFRNFVMVEVLEETIMPIWKRANTRIVEVVGRPDVTPEESVKKGREIFYGKGGCVQCHGDSAMGDGQIYYVNDLDPQRSKDIKQLVNPSFPMQPLKPRNLRYTVIRGPSRDIDLYRRLRNGIDAVAMPAPTIPPEEVWHLVDYVKSLPYEFNEPGPTQSENTRAN